MDWFDPSDEVVVHPNMNRARWWRRLYGTECIEVGHQVLYATNPYGKFFDVLSESLDRRATVLCDYRTKGYIHYQTSCSESITLYQAPIPAPWAANALELLISAGARQIVFLNGAGSLRPDVPVGSIVLPGELIREEGTSFHYAPPDVLLRTSGALNERIQCIADSLGVELARGKHWTTDALYRETFSKVERYREHGVVSIDMELSALAGVARFRGCELSSLLVVTDVLSRSHTWDGVTTARFHQGVQWATQIATQVFLGSGNAKIR